LTREGPPPHSEPAGAIWAKAQGGAPARSATAFPMHVGLFVEDASDDSVIESTLPSEGCTDDYARGVEVHHYVGALDAHLGLATVGFKELCGEHVFMGARVPYDTEDVLVTDEVRAAVVAAAKARTGDPYGILTLDHPGWGDGTFGGPFTVSITLEIIITNRTTEIGPAVFFPVVDQADFFNECLKAG